jgi:hypothetical protein
MVLAIFKFFLWFLLWFGAFGVVFLPHVVDFARVYCAFMRALA